MPEYIKQDSRLKKNRKWCSDNAFVLPNFLRRRPASKQDSTIDTKSQEERRWRLLQAESSLACNLQCVMCPWRGTFQAAAGNGIMSQEVWEAIKPNLSQVLSVDFSGGGEPLLQPRLEQWIMEAKGAGCEVGFLTNGLLMVKEKAKRMINEGLDWIGFSMDGATAGMYEEIRKGSSFERVCENLATVAALQIGKVPKTMINFVLMDMNFHQVDEIVRLAARLGVDQVNFKQCDVIRGKEGKGDEDEHQAGADLRPQDVPLPVQNQLEYVSRDEEDQQDDQDDVDVDEREDDDVAGEGHLAADRPQARLQDRETGHQDGNDPDGDPLPLLLRPISLRGQVRLPGKIFFHGAEMSPLAQSVSTSHREEKKKIERSGSDRPTLSRRVRTSARYRLPRVTSS